MRCSVTWLPSKILPKPFVTSEFESQLAVVAEVMADKSIPNRSRCRLKELRRRLPKDADLDRLNRVWRAMRVAEIYKGWHSP